MLETKAGAAERATCVRDTTPQEHDYITVCVRLRPATVADVNALVDKAGPERSSFDRMLRLCAVTGVEYWKTAEGKAGEEGASSTRHPRRIPPMDPRRPHAQGVGGPPYAQ